MGTALIDADVLAYSCGFASQRLLTGVFEEGETFLDVDPPEYALSLVNKSLRRIAETAGKQGYGDVKLFLTGTGNFRTEIAKVAPYKGNRVQEKPAHFHLLRKYMVERWDAVIVDGIEADDAIATAACKLDYDPRTCLIVSQDKDFLTVPGMLWNPREENAKRITRKQALRNEARQILTGDVADNIPGCYKTGTVTAHQLISDDLPKGQITPILLRQFERSRSIPGCRYADREAEDVLLEMGRLVHLKRSEDDLWNPY